MGVFKVTVDEAGERLSKQTLVFCLLFASIGITIIIMQRSGPKWVRIEE
jgi:hypothetical protein